MALDLLKAMSPERRQQLAAQDEARRRERAKREDPRPLWVITAEARDGIKRVPYPEWHTWGRPEPSKPESVLAEEKRTNLVYEWNPRSERFQPPAPPPPMDPVMKRIAAELPPEKQPVRTATGWAWPKPPTVPEQDFYPNPDHLPHTPSGLTLRYPMNSSNLQPTRD